jgi:hypothetical protein
MFRFQVAETRHKKGGVTIPYTQEGERLKINHFVITKFLNSRSTQQQLRDIFISSQVPYAGRCGHA